MVVAAAGWADCHPRHGQAGAAVVSAGTSWEGRKHPRRHAAVAEVAGWITPRIGGVGPMTRAMLLATPCGLRRWRRSEVGIPATFAFAPWASHVRRQTPGE